MKNSIVLMFVLKDCSANEQPPNLVQINKLQPSATFKMVNVLIYLSTSSPRGNTLTGREKNQIYLYMYKGAKGVKDDVDK